MNESQKKPLSIELPANLESIYANFSLISHTPSEIIFDLSQLLPNQPKARVKARVIMTPLNAKLFLRALEENLSKFEARYGEITLPRQGDDLVQAFFGGVKPPEKE
ncbi:MAG: DUF3467 domain-containing protein [Anaerolineae bacterium]|nr:DUF3467 domain-containing protein [Anaerolineae bacterium]